MYTTYATEYKILFQNGFIGKDSYRIIPKSTRNEWKSKNFDNIYGAKEIEDLIFHYKTVKENRIARSTLYGLCKIIIIYKHMLNNTPNMKKLLFENKSAFLRNIDLLVNIYDLKLVLKLLGFSYNQISYWKNVFDSVLENEKRVIIYTDDGSENRSVMEAFISGKNNTVC